MQSGIAIPIFTDNFLYGIIYINFLSEFLSDKKTVCLIEKFKKIMDQLLDKNQIKDEIKKLKK
jgi:hypothetical protein